VDVGPAHVRALARVQIENLGPFKSAEVELRSLTVFVGRNSVGKSLLMRLLWALAALRLTLHMKWRVRELEAVQSSVLDYVKRGDAPPLEGVRALVGMYLDLLRESAAREVERALKCALRVGPGGVIKVGAQNAKVTVSGPCGPTSVIINSDGSVNVELDLCAGELARGLRAHVPARDVLRLSYTGKFGSFEVEEVIRESLDLTFLIFRFLMLHADALFKHGFFIG
jgi:hypothetical protein